MATIEGFDIAKASEVFSDLVNYRQTYHEKGKYLGFEKLDVNYSMSLGNCTDWTGFPMSGKTQVLIECLLNTSIYYGWKHLVYFPDVGNKIEIIADLINKYTGKTFNNLKENVITDQEISTASEWVCHHFKVLTKKDIKAKLTPIQFWDLAVLMQKEDELHTASIDSWKDLNHNYAEFGGYAQYLEYVLPYRNQIAEDNNLHLHTIIHPKLPEKDKNGNRKAPNPYDLKGGSEWFNSGKCMITIHREDIMDNRVEIHVNKIKPRSNGSVGMCELWFDVNTLTYYDVDISNPNQHKRIYASGIDKEPLTITQISAMKPNNDFEKFPF